MAGRHVQAPQAEHPHRLRLVVAAAVVVVLAAAGVLTAVLLDSPKKSTAAPVASHAPTCSAGVALSVVAADSIAPVISDIAQSWVATHPFIDGACPTVTVRPESSSSAEADLAKPGVVLPDVWIPDSSLWIQRLRTDTTGMDADVQSMWLSPSIASSPLVLATTAPNAQAVSAAATKGWGAALTGSAGVFMVDPATTTDGLLALLTAQSLISPPKASDDGTTAPSRDLVSAMVKLAHASLPDAGAGFLSLTQHPAANISFPASEQEVIEANAGAGTQNMATAIYPSGKGLALDFPVAQFAPPGGVPAQRDAAVRFVNQLTSTAAQQLLRTAGLRAANGAPLPATATASDSPTASSSASATSPPAPAPVENNLARPSAATVADGLRVWSAAGRESRTLLVIDTSGSMNDSIGGGQSKIQFAAKAERAAIDFFPDSSSLGLWTFSSRSAPQQDWTEVVSLGPLGSKVGTGTRRQALIAASPTLPGRVVGATGLYATTLAAFEAVRTTFDPAQANSVVLLTDGSNTDTSGIDLTTLLSTLRSQTRANTPVPIYTIAVGQDADQATLKQISQATGGTMLVASEPGDIRDAVLDALVAAA